MKAQIPKDENNDSLLTSTAADTDSGSHNESTEPPPSPEDAKKKKMKAYWDRFRVSWPKSKSAPAALEDVPMEDARPEASSSAHPPPLCDESDEEFRASQPGSPHPDLDVAEWEHQLAMVADSHESEEEVDKSEMSLCGRCFGMQDHCLGDGCPACEVAMKGGTEGEALTAMFAAHKASRTKRVREQQEDAMTMKTPPCRPPTFFGDAIVDTPEKLFAPEAGCSFLLVFMPCIMWNY